MEEIIKKIEFFLLNEINSKNVIVLFYKIGFIIEHKKLTNYDLKKLDSILREKYGLIISLSKKNLLKMHIFYNKFKDIDIKLLKEIDWNTYLLIINKDNRIELINTIIKYRLNKRETEYYIKTKKFNKIEMNYCDPATDELIKLQQNMINFKK